MDARRRRGRPAAARCLLLLLALLAMVPLAQAAPRIGIEQMVSEMVRSDLREAERDSLCKSQGFTVFDYNE